MRGAVSFIRNIVLSNGLSMQNKILEKAIDYTTHRYVVGANNVKNFSKFRNSSLICNLKLMYIHNKTAYAHNLHNFIPFLIYHIPLRSHSSINSIKI